MTKNELLGQYNFVEKIQLILMWAYDRTLGKRRKGIYELKHLIQDVDPNHVSFSRQGRNNLITITGDPHIGDTKILVRRLSSDVPVFNQVFFYKEYQAVVDEIMKRNEQGTIRFIIDAGANVGFTSIYFAKCFPDARIISIEPEESNYRMMLENFKLNDLPSITPLKQALWSKSTDLEIDRGFRDHREWAVAVKPANDSTSERVQGVTLPELCKNNYISKIDILKIDIEGAERFLFDSEERVKQFLPMTRYIAMEIHDEYHIRDMILGFLKQFHFSYFTSGELIIAINEEYQS